MSEAYDPLVPPDPEDWLSMDEQDRLDLIMEYHQDADVELPNEEVHAVIHTIVENQAAMGDEVSTQRTLYRLTREGLDRHEAIHAIGSVLIDFMQSVITGDADALGANRKYIRALKKLTAAKWRKEFG